MGRFFRGGGGFLRRGEGVLKKPVEVLKEFDALPSTLSVSPQTRAQAPKRTSSPSRLNIVRRPPTPKGPKIARLKINSVHTRCNVKTSGFTRGVCKKRGFC